MWSYLNVFCTTWRDNSVISFSYFFIIKRSGVVIYEFSNEVAKKSKMIRPALGITHSIRRQLESTPQPNKRRTYFEYMLQLVIANLMEIFGKKHFLQWLYYFSFYSSGNNISLIDLILLNTNTSIYIFN